MKITTRLKLNTVLAAESNQMAAGLKESHSPIENLQQENLWRAVL
jgi:hypothetical protein